MKFLFTIALLALIGCAGNKSAKTLPTCEEFYDFYKKEAKRLSELWEWEFPEETKIDTIFYKRLEILENGVKKYNCNETITCNEKTYCFESIFF